MKPETEPVERIGTKQDVADYIGATIRTVENNMRSGVLPYRKIGRLVRFDMEEVKQALAERCGKNSVRKAIVTRR